MRSELLFTQRRIWEKIWLTNDTGIIFEQAS